MILQKYDSYKDSGIEWVGEIPENWEVKRGKDLFRLSNIAAKKGHDLQLLSVYSSIGVRPRSELEQRGNKAFNIDEYWIVKKGDIIINKLLAWMGGIGLSKYDGVTSPAYDILRKKITLNERYYELLFRLKKSQIEFKRHSRGILEIRLRLYNDRFNQISFQYPDIDEQNKITHYLNEKVIQINLKIKQLQNKATSYKELKKSVINKAIHFGVEEHKELKDSGIKWIGKIPKHWKIERFKDSHWLYTGNSIADKELYSSSKNSFSYVATKDININNNYVNYDNGVNILKTDTNFKVAKSGSILLCIEGANAGKKMAIIDREVCFVNKLCALKSKCNKVVDKFVFYYVNSLQFNNQFFSILNGLIGGVSIGLIKMFYISLPSKEEQIEIVNYLDEKTSKIDKIVSKINYQIETLKEFRKTLINDVVTGKVRAENE